MFALKPAVIVTVTVVSIIFSGCSSTSTTSSSSTTATPGLSGEVTTGVSSHSTGSAITTTTFMGKTNASTFTTATATYPATSQSPTSRSKPSTQCSGKMLGTYTWSQDYWRNNDDLLFAFLNSDMGQQWNCGDVSVNIADSSNPNFIATPENLVNFMVNFRRKTNNQGILWLTYGDVVSKEGALMVMFVQTFKNFLINYVDANTMAEIAPIGLSFDVEHVAQNYVKEALQDAQQMKTDLQTHLGYLPNSIYVQYTIEGAPDTLGTQYVMQYADSALMMLYRNEIVDTTGNDPDDLLGRLRWMLHDQCLVCTQPGWENLKAKITIMVEGSCKLGANCHKISMCAFDSVTYPNPSGGIEYAWNTLNQLNSLIVPDGIVSQEQYDGLFNHEGTLFSLHNFEWTRCYYGDSFSQLMGYDDYCPQYHTYATTCRSE